MKLCTLIHQALLFISTQKAEGISEQDIEKNLQWKEKKLNRYIIAEDVSEFCQIYKEYIDEIVNYINRKE